MRVDGVAPNAVEGEREYGVGSERRRSARVRGCVRIAVGLRAGRATRLGASASTRKREAQSWTGRDLRKQSRRGREASGGLGKKWDLTLVYGWHGRDGARRATGCGGYFFSTLVSSTMT